MCWRDWMLKGATKKGGNDNINLEGCAAVREKISG